jgi:hypothetical protein
MILDLILKDIDDEYVRENFSRIARAMKGEALGKAGWKFFSISLSAGLTRYQHNLGYVPKDIIVTAVSGGETVIFNYDDFDNTHIEMEASGACTVRFFAGTYGEQL